MIIKKSDVAKGLPRETTSLCPECKKTIRARVFEENGKAMIEKTCPEHGYFKDVYWSDADMYLRFEKFSYDGVGLENPQTKREKGCPYDCGLCDEHKSHTMLSNIDLTNRCNLKCPICFANANAAGYVYELTYEQIVDMLRLLRNNKPVPCQAVQFSGGEPTIHPDILAALKAAKDMGFIQVQIATNGITIANDPAFAQKMIDAGMNTVYLSFDGLDDKQYIETRGRPLLETKLKVIEIAKQTTPKMSIVLVPTIVNTINDDQVGPIYGFAVKNVDVIRSVNYQPVSFTGRISMEELAQQRFTIPDLVDRLHDYTGGLLSKKDFYPIPTVAPLSELVSVISKSPKLAFTTNTHCGAATYVFVEKTDNPEPKVIPITHFVDVDGFIEETNALIETVGDAHFRKISLALHVRRLMKYIDDEKAPSGLNLRKLITALMVNEPNALRKFSWHSMLIGAMHFQDCYNYDVERVKRCGIHQATPDGRLIPFCAYNSGPYFREEVEKKFSVSFDEWKSQHESTSKENKKQ